MKRGKSSAGARVHIILLPVAFVGLTVFLMWVGNLRPYYTHVYWGECAITAAVIIVVVEVIGEVAAILWRAVRSLMR